MRLRLVREPFDHPDYIFELKHDGFRALKLDIVTSQRRRFSICSFSAVPIS